MASHPDSSALAQVVAWHNRHPLAQRITPAQVVGLGTVALPFVVEAAAQPAHSGALDLVAVAAASAAKAKRRAFSEHVVPSPSLPALERFALRHGAPIPTHAALMAPGPQREVPADAKLQGGAPVALLYLGTAAIEDGSRRVRVLWGDLSRRAIIGQRLWSRARMAACGLISAAGVLAAVVLPQLSLEDAQLPTRSPVSPVPAAPVLGHVMPPAPDAVVAAAPIAAEPEVVFPPPPPALEGDAWPVNIRPSIDPPAHRTAKGASAGSRTVKTTPAKATPDSKQGAVYALVARSTRSRVASQMLLGYMQTAAAAKTQTNQRTEVLPDAQGWRASWWPFANRQDAERARAHLASNGLRADIVEF